MTVKRANISICVDKTLIGIIDERRGLVGRSRFLEAIIKKELEKK